MVTIKKKNKNLSMQIFFSPTSIDFSDSAICIDQAKAPTCIVARPDANGSCCCTLSFHLEEAYKKKTISLSNSSFIFSAHNFCEACITQWVQRPPPGQPANCPTCQREILGLIPNLVARDLLVRLSERKGLLKDREDVIKRLEDRVQQLVQVNADADADINRLRSEADSYKADKERILAKMKEFEDRLQRCDVVIRCGGCFFLWNDGMIVFFSSSL